MLPGRGHVPRPVRGLVGSVPGRRPRRAAHGCTGGRPAHFAADTTRLVDRLVKLRLATRRPSLADRRVVLVSATSRGRQLFERVTAEIKALHRRQWAALTTEELRALTRLLNKALWTDAPAPVETAAMSVPKH